MDTFFNGWIEKNGSLDGQKKQVNSWKDEKNRWMVGWLDEQKIIYIYYIYIYKYKQMDNRKD